MPANVHGKMVYSFEKPMWHGLTEPSLVPMSATKILVDKFGGGFPIFTRPVSVELNGVQVETGDFAVVRGVSPYDPKEVVFGYCTERYHPLQPVDIAHSYDVNVMEPAETMAFLGEGQEMFISWKMPEFEVVKEDVVKLFGIIRCGFDTMKSARLFTSAVRPVCWNTITMAEGWAKRNSDGKGKGMIWKGKGVNKNLLRDLGYWMSHVQLNAIREANLVQSFFGKLAQVPVKSEAQFQDILNSAYPNANDNSEYFPPQLREGKLAQIQNINDHQNAIRVGIGTLFSGAGTAITPDLWGVMNATSEFFCHVFPSKKPIAESVMFGSRQKEIMSMVDTLAKIVK